MTTEYIPDTGHIVWISLDPQRGREQAGHRPFLVLSPRRYNARTSLIVGVPVTAKRKGYPFQVELPSGGAIDGVVLADQLKSFDWRMRGVDHAQIVDPTTLRDVKSLIATFLSLR